MQLNFLLQSCVKQNCSLVNVLCKSKIESLKDRYYENCLTSLPEVEVM